MPRDGGTARDIPKFRRLNKACYGESCTFFGLVDLSRIPKVNLAFHLLRGLATDTEPGFGEFAIITGPSHFQQASAIALRFWLRFPALSQKEHLGPPFAFFPGDFKILQHHCIKPSPSSSNPAYAVAPLRRRNHARRNIFRRGRACPWACRWVHRAPSSEGRGGGPQHSHRAHLHTSTTPHHRVTEPHRSIFATRQMSEMLSAHIMAGAAFGRSCPCTRA